MTFEPVFLILYSRRPDGAVSVDRSQASSLEVTWMVRASPWSDGGAVVRAGGEGGETQAGHEGSDQSGVRHDVVPSGRGAGQEAVPAGTAGVGAGRWLRLICRKNSVIVTAT